VVTRSVWRALPRPLRSWTASLSKSLLDPNSANRTVALLLLAYAALWAFSASVRTLGLTLHYDMVQVFAYSREFAFGYDRHPPLINWIVAAWFAVMPVQPWAYYLLGGLNAALGLYAVWLAAGYVADLRRRVIAVAVLGLIPPFTFLAATFNHNTVQLSLWPLVTLAFLASIARPGLVWSVLFGLVSALAMLAKYYAGLIVVACALAALVHPNRDDYFRSWRPYVAAVTCVAVMIPNLIWLMDIHLFPIIQPVDDFGHNGVSSVAVQSFKYLTAFVLLLAPALLVMAALPRPSFGAAWRNLQDALPPMLAVVVCIALVPIILPVLIFPIAGIAPRIPWAYPAFFFAPLALIASLNVVVSRRAVALAVVGAAALAGIGVAASPILMVAAFKLDSPLRVAPHQALAQFVTETWHCLSGRRLGVIGGSHPIAQSISFYSQDHPVAVPTSSATTPAAILDKQWSNPDMVGVCGAAETLCNDIVAQLLPRAERTDVAIPVTFLRMQRGTDRFVLYFPATERPATAPSAASNPVAASRLAHCAVPPQP
jgi:4-amino-4-deoxy-L-arabinose transferase-like glycosyltransferase